MKSKIFKKWLAALLTTAMVVGVAACGNDNPAASQTSEETKVSETTATEPSSEVVEETGVTFPLEEEVTFKLMVRYDGDISEELEKSAHWQRLYEQTNVKIEFITMPKEGTMNSLNAMFQAGQEGDAIFGEKIVSDSDVIALASNGLLMPLNEYVDDAELMPNLNERVFAESPNTKGYITAPDGNIYSLPTYTALEGNYVENPLWINKAWLDKLGKDIPKTIEDLEDVLIAFRDNDANGNGVDDEIPYLVWSKHSMAHLEAIMALWGIATKDSANDHYVYIQDGQVVYAPASDAWKEAIITLNKWYEEDLIWSEVFTANNDTYNAKQQGNDDVAFAGMLTSKTLPANIADQYVRLEPVKVEGYEARWFQHPGLQGSRGMFSITRSCENPEILMAWIDLFYSLENTVASMYGDEEYGRYKITDDGKYEFISLTADQSAELDKKDPRLTGLISNLPKAFTAADYANRIVLSGKDLTFTETFEVYKDYMAKEYWPRPYIAADDSTRLGELRTDISNTVTAKKAAWITGDGDIEAEWDKYVQSLEKMGLEEYVSILQKAYDVYIEGMK